ncbi:esterase/lipase family protein [Pseudomonas sp. EL_65y_Pfl2_R96]|uniref:esterase/lipase family protein n=1 Tax=Pseudomonas sp. EL_65y_Pfl2_R96 TaxID=3088699 RepID=UPI0030DDA0F4
MVSASATRKVILFVHGLSGSAEGTWGKMIEFFRRDEGFSDFHLDSYQYPTAKFRLPFGKKMPGIQDLAEGLRSYISAYHGDKSEIILIGHSMGGLVLRQYITNELKKPTPTSIRAAIMIATPHTGAALASIGSNLSWKHTHLKQLAKGQDILRSILEDWATLNIENRIDTLYITGGLDAIVDRQSSMPYYGNVKFENLINYGHIDVIKPDHAADIRYIVIKKFITELPPAKKFNVAQPNAVGWPLFYRYDLSCEKFYYIRSSDKVIEQALSGSNVWLSGPAGVGKTVALTRAILLKGWQPFYFTLDGFSELPAENLLKEVCRLLYDRLGLPDEDLSKSSSLPDILRSFSLAFTSSVQTCKIAIFIEEIPITSVEEYSKFLDLACHLSMIQDSCTFPHGVVWVFSSIVDPMEYTQSQNIKLQERYEFLKADIWSTFEINALMNMLTDELNIQFSNTEKEEILSGINNSPRYLKMLLKACRTELGSKKSVAELISSISMVAR